MTNPRTFESQPSSYPDNLWNTLYTYSTLPQALARLPSYHSSTPLSYLLFSPSHGYFSNFPDILQTVFDKPIKIVFIWFRSFTAGKMKMPLHILRRVMDYTFFVGDDALICMMSIFKIIEHDLDLIKNKFSHWSVGSETSYHFSIL